MIKLYFTTRKTNTFMYRINITKALLGGAVMTGNEHESGWYQ